MDLEAAELRLPDSKMGPRTVSLSPTALRVLQGIPHLPDSPWVIPGKVAARPMRNLNDPWDVIYERAGLKDTRILDCRHSYASRAVALGARASDDRSLAGGIRRLRRRSDMPS